MHSQFTVAGMSSSTSSHHSPNLNSWGSTSTGGPLSSSFGDSLSQSRSHYQPGYLMSSSQSNNVPQGSQRVDEVPVVQTKAKMNQILSRGSTTDFGMDSMFQSSRQRQSLPDEDAPPMSSVNDIPNEINMDPSPAHFQSRKALNDRASFSSSRRPTNSALSSANQAPNAVYIVVFGYPPDKYSLTVEYFRSLGETTDPDANSDVSNCFKLGYRDPGDAMRAVRKNGEILGGSWMIGAKWADPLQAEAILGLQPVLRSAFSSPTSQQPPHASSFPDFSSGGQSNAMAVDEQQPWMPSSSTAAVGTPIKLAPSLAAFRKAGPASSSHPKPATPQQAAPAWGTGLLSTPVNVSGQNTAGGVGVQASPSKGLVGQMSDLIFGW
ncbi:hypothetical protein GALMADRAFT_222564 [Galerina marginata CBS 339.88]|uniref:RRM Nup35-type domain-containing protein n=1 Tax=Galerina marginata (strain CBS 339.88) TaxID=685588 RepID=A0A067TPV3_GALM3|nr:hypothetical protein GALMADRAFT_222564 [Galerina marginata CBS 339.88]